MKSYLFPKRIGTLVVRGPFASMFVESAVMYLMISLGFAIHMTPILVNEKWHSAGESQWRSLL